MIQAIRGMNDILPEQSDLWQYVEEGLKTVVEQYSYKEIRFPIVEQTELFKRTIGEVTDIVEKEMYTFCDKNGDSLTLRPEGTACCVRAGIEHGLFYHQIQRLWYRGPMFRHERPQKGRYRQFHQFGVEAFGLIEPDIDIEMILMSARFWKFFGLDKTITLQINSLGTLDERKIYRQALVNYFEQFKDQLDEDSQRRLHTNPLRILDSKNPYMKEMISAAPSLMDYLGDESKAHFKAVCEGLTRAGVAYEINPFLVRGLDYYSHTVFEWVTDQLGSQGTVCAGGRFNTLVEQLGGKPTAAIGFALGIERLIGLVETVKQASDFFKTPKAYFVLVGEAAQKEGLVIAESLRDRLPHLRLMTNCGGGSFKNQFKRADKSGAHLAIVIGDEELEKNCFTLKYLREEKPQIQVVFDELLKILANDVM